MAEENVADANAASGNADVSVSSIDDGFRNIDPSVDNVPTVDVIPEKEGADKAAVDAAKVAEDAAKVADDAAKAKDGEGDKTKPYHQDPDWQRMIKERDDARIEAAAAKAKLGVLTSKEVDVAKAAPGYKDITLMSKEELIEWQEDDPHGYAANLYAQVRSELKAEVERERAQTTVKGTFEKYEKDNPDFRTKWDSGEIRAFMDANPGHNAISAHMMMVEPARKEAEKATVDAAIAKAVKEKEAEVVKNFQAKKNAQVISDGGAVKTDTGVADELKNPQKYGGAVAALALRLSRLRQASAG